MMTAIDDLLNPIPGDNPCGADLRYDPVYDKIKEARREDDASLQGEWQHELKRADHPQVIKLCREALSKRTKDLQLAVWLMESSTKKDGMAAFADGLVLCQRLLENFWDGLYPQIDEDGDKSFRAMPLEYVGSKFGRVLKNLRLTKGGFDWNVYKESRSVPYLKDVEDDDDKLRARRKLVEPENPMFRKTPPEEFDEQLFATPKDFYKALVEQIAQAEEQIAALDEKCTELFGNDAPSFGSLRDELTEVNIVAKELLRRKREVEPDEDEPAQEAEAEEYAAAVEEYEAPVSTGGGAGAAPARAKAPAAKLTAEPTDEADAYARVVAVAKWLRTEQPGNPVSYLLLRALRWGELRKNGEYLDEGQLDPPDSPVRVKVVKSFREGEWSDVISSGEDVMATKAGTGWMDLQRYVGRALEEIGYSGAAMAVRAELRGLLQDYPSLVEAKLLDETPAASEDTRSWIRDVILPKPPEPQPVQSAEEEEQSFTSVQYNDEPEAANQHEPDVVQRAQELASDGDLQGAIVLMTEAANTSKSRRERFRRMVQLADICVRAGQRRIATPILQTLLAEVEQRRLEEWESSELLSPALMLLYECMRKGDASAEEKEALFARICRIDPAAAMTAGK